MSESFIWIFSIVEYGLGFRPKHSSKASWSLEFGYIYVPDPNSLVLDIPYLPSLLNLVNNSLPLSKISLLPTFFYAATARM